MAAIKCPYCGNLKAVKVGRKIKCNVCGYGVTKSDVTNWERQIRKIRKKGKKNSDIVVVEEEKKNNIVVEDNKIVVVEEKPIREAQETIRKIISKDGRMSNKDKELLQRAYNTIAQYGIELTRDYFYNIVREIFSNNNEYLKLQQRRKEIIIVIKHITTIGNQYINDYLLNIAQKELKRVTNKIKQMEKERHKDYIEYKKLKNRVISRLRYISQLEQQRISKLYYKEKLNFAWKYRNLLWKQYITNKSEISKEDLNSIIYHINLGIRQLSRI